ncbi:TPA: cystatin-like fold lipoprotein [Staphylococcus aureus]|uniref:Cystatin-like fold lipoprotein n=1 Tax=Staphylococcus aureus TaxID=1280 RepID=A0A6A8FZ28_STAAU|nr:cystatin-like fold lipoprotein [Staphylococcus aureus]MRV78287.1 cystatin-like fold lipoprotein [Staphylococcus aureus]MRW28744.1 cystatin-like fold lipoprotein [Staphylococcus aureus]HEH3444413.1 cystatin-like fold lipoprotein [Staphylococcus aureus]
MRRWFVLILGLVILLSACGQKYDKEIDEVTKLEKENKEETKDSNSRKIERKTSYFKVYDGGKVITVTYLPFKDSDVTTSKIYKLNETTEKYEKDYNQDAEKYEKSNKPEYEENNMKK